MRVTEKFKAQLRIARAMGYTYVYSVCGAYRATTYVWIWTIGDLLSMRIGTQTGGRPRICQHMWSGWPNTRQLTKNHISYSQTMRIGAWMLD